MDFDAIFDAQLAQLKEEGNYRIFAELERKCGQFPKAKCYDDDTPDEVTVWCSNDYLGMGQHPKVREAMKNAIDTAGCGAGGTRNISAGTGIGRSSRKRKRAFVYIWLCVELGSTWDFGVTHSKRSYSF